MSIMRLFGEYENTFEVSFLELHLCAPHSNFEAVADCVEDGMGGRGGKMNGSSQAALDFANPDSR